MGRQVMSYQAMLMGESGTIGMSTVMQAVLREVSLGDPYQEYLDQLLIAMEVDALPTEEVTSYLWTLKSSWPQEYVPYLYYTVAQIESDLGTKIMTLLELAETYPKHQLSLKACYLAGKLTLQVAQDDTRRELLDRVVALSPSKSLKAKILSWRAEEGSDKEDFYMLALEHSDLQQTEKLRLNYNLAELYLPEADRLELILSADQMDHFLFEKALQIKGQKPERAIALLEEFLQGGDDEERDGLAHLTLAELLLARGLESDWNAIKAHLETVVTFYPSYTEEYSRLQMARLRLGVLMEDEKVISEVLSYESSDLIFLLKSGQLLYESGNPHAASKQFLRSERLNDLTPREQELSSFYLALCNVNLGTEAHMQNAVERLARIASDEKSVFHSSATGILAQHYLDRGEPQKVLELLATIPTQGVSHRHLKARALSLSKKPEDIEEARSEYDKLFREASLPLLERYRVAHQYCQFLEVHERRGEALEMYYQVANFEVLAEPDSNEGWEIYKNIGMKGVTLLESIGQWRSAYNYAKVISKTASPDRAYFDQKANEISLKHILWDEGDL